MIESDRDSVHTNSISTISLILLNLQNGKLNHDDSYQTVWVLPPHLNDWICGLRVKMATNVVSYHS